jgi:hypothetical protein
MARVFLDGSDGDLLTLFQEEFGELWSEIASESRRCDLPDGN